MKLKDTIIINNKNENFNLKYEMYFETIIVCSLRIWETCVTNTGHN